MQIVQKLDTSDLAIALITPALSFNDIDLLNFVELSS
jgi:hypothetical protein